MADKKPLDYIVFEVPESLKKTLNQQDELNDRFYEISPKLEEMQKEVSFEIPESLIKIGGELDKSFGQFSEILQREEERQREEAAKFFAKMRASQEEAERRKRYEEAMIELAERSRQVSPLAAESVVSRRGTIDSPKATGSAVCRKREDNLTRAIHAAIAFFGKKPSIGELWQYFQEDKDETGFIEDYTDTHITWRDTKGIFHDTPKTSIANRLSRIKL
jgi:hypothetical protein